MIEDDFSNIWSPSTQAKGLRDVKSKPSSPTQSVESFDLELYRGAPVSPLTIATGTVKAKCHHLKRSRSANRLSRFIVCPEEQSVDLNEDIDKFKVEDDATPDPSSNKSNRADIVRDLMKSPNPPKYSVSATNLKQFKSEFNDYLQSSKHKKNSERKKQKKRAKSNEEEIELLTNGINDHIAEKMELKLKLSLAQEKIGRLERGGERLAAKLTEVEADLAIIQRIDSVDEENGGSQKRRYKTKDHDTILSKMKEQVKQKDETVQSLRQENEQLQKLVNSTLERAEIVVKERDTTISKLEGKLKNVEHIVKQRELEIKSLTDDKQLNGLDSDQAINNLQQELIKEKIQQDRNRDTALNEEQDEEIMEKEKSIHVLQDEQIINNENNNEVQQELKQVKNLLERESDIIEDEESIVLHRARNNDNNILSGEISKEFQKELDARTALLEERNDAVRSLQEEVELISNMVHEREVAISELLIENEELKAESEKTAARLQTKNENQKDAVTGGNTGWGIIPSFKSSVDKDGSVARVRELEAEIDELKGFLTEAAQEAKKFETKALALEEELEVRNNNNENGEYDANASLRAWRQKVWDAEENVSRLKKECDDLREEANKTKKELSEALATNKTQLDELLAGCDMERKLELEAAETSHNSVVTELKEELSKLQSMNSTTLSKLSESDDKVSRLEFQCKQLLSEANQAKAMLGSVQDAKVEAVHTQYKVLIEGAKEMHRNELAEIETKHKEALTAITSSSDLSGDVTRLESECDELRAEADRAKSVAEETKAKSAAEQADIHAEYKIALEASEATNVEKLRTEHNAALAAAEEKHKVEVSCIESKYKEKLDEATSSRSECLSNLLEAKDTIASLQSEIHSIKSALSNAQKSQSADRKDDFANHTAVLQELEAKYITELAAMKTKHDNELSKALTEKSATISILSETEETLARLQSECNELNKEMEKIKSDATEEETNHRNKLSKALSERENAMSMLSKTEEYLARLQSECDELREELDKVKTILENAKDSHTLQLEDIHSKHKLLLEEAEKRYKNDIMRLEMKLRNLSSKPDSVKKESDASTDTISTHQSTQSNEDIKAEDSSSSESTEHLVRQPGIRNAWFTRRSREEPGIYDKEKSIRELEKIRAQQDTELDNLRSCLVKMQTIHDKAIKETIARENQRWTEETKFMVRELIADKDAEKNSSVAEIKIKMEELIQERDAFQLKAMVLEEELEGQRQQ